MPARWIPSEGREKRVCSRPCSLLCTLHLLPVSMSLLCATMVFLLCVFLCLCNSYRDSSHPGLRSLCSGNLYSILFTPAAWCRYAGCWHVYRVMQGVCGCHAFIPGRSTFSFISPLENFLDNSFHFIFLMKFAIICTVSQNILIYRLNYRDLK